MTAAESSAGSRSRLISFGVFLVVLTGLLLRFAGLSHDLHAGYSYHPDTPKQVRAAERFLKGTYYVRIGHSDYDGYPSFASHLVEWSCRAAGPVVEGARRLLGLPEQKDWPSTTDLYWVARVVNALLASLLPYLVYRCLRRIWGSLAGLLAALFLALSPADIAACHYEAGDTAAAFFATLAVLWALAVHRDGRLRDLVIGTFFAVCAFAAKYHGGLAGLSVALAFALRQGSLRACFAREAWRGWIVMAVAALVSAFLAMPALFIHPVFVIEDIRGFLAYASSFHLPDEIAHAGFLKRLIFGLKRNVPAVVDVLSAPVACAFVVGLVMGLRRDRRLLILAVLPLGYLVFGLGLRAMSHPVYHTLMTGSVFGIAGVMLATPRSFSLRGSYQAGASLLAIAAAGYLLNAALNEAFFFWHSDTRRLAQAWTRENVPSTFQIHNQPYTFALREYAGTNASPDASLWLTSSIRSDPPPPGYFRFKQFRLEDESLPLFRNPVIDLYLKSGNVIRDDFLTPVFQRRPSEIDNELVFAGGPKLYRSEKMWHLGPREKLQRILVTDEPFGDALVAVQAGGQAATVQIDIGSHHDVLALGAGELRILKLAYLDRGYPPFVMGRYFYRIGLEAYHGRASVVLATSPLDRALMLYGAGRYAEAYPWLIEAARANRHPTVAAMALIAARAAGLTPDEKTRSVLNRIVRDFERLRGPDDLMESYGISLDYLNGLPYWAARAEKLPVRGFRVARELQGGGLRALAPVPSLPAGDEGNVLLSPSLLLEPGVYTARLRVMKTTADEGGRLRAAAEDTSGATLSVGYLGLTRLPAGRYDELSFTFEVPDFAPEIRLAFSSTNAPGLVMDRLEVRPDPLGTLRALGRLLAVAQGGEPANLPLLAYRPLLALAGQATREENWPRAYQLLAAAADLRPLDAAPLEGLEFMYRYLTDEQRAALGPRFTQVRASAPARALHTCSARFAGGFELRGFRLSSSTVARGGELGLNLYWLLHEKDVNTRSCVVWVHFVDASGKVVFQGDHELARALRHRWETSAANPSFFRIPVPAQVPPGTYAIRMGLYEPRSGDRLRVQAADLEHGKRALTLPVSVTVE